MLRIPLDFCLNANYKGDGFSKTLQKKSVKFFLSKKDDIITFNLSLVLLPTEFDLISKKQSCKKNMLRNCGVAYMNIVPTLSTKVIIFHIRATIV